ncbi:MAG: hypothetical protein J6Z43_02025 [Clostridiales bacterium]|nr:hypothetical protein [Clostridiales bacterium]
MSELNLDMDALENVTGGFNVDDLSPEDLAEVQRLGGMLIEIQLAKNSNDPSYDRDKHKELAMQLNELYKRLQQKYG